MVRDGVAWYYKSEAVNFTESEDQTYLGCEQAARSEARGLWRDPSALAPWTFRWQEAANRNLISKPQELLGRSGRGSKQPLSNDDVFSSMTGTGRLAAGRSNEADPGWKTLTPQPRKFSIYVPRDSLEFAATIPTPTGKNVEANYAVGRRGVKSYLVIWARGPSDGVTEDLLADDTANGIGYGLQRSTGQSFEVKRQRSVRLGPYSGWQYTLSASGIPGTIRVYSRRIGQLRELYVMACVNASEDDPQVKEFFGSFTIDKF